MASSGPNSPSTTSSTTFTNPGNVTSSDNSYATFTTAATTVTEGTSLRIRLGNVDVGEIKQASSLQSTEAYWSEGGSTDIWDYSFLTAEIINDSDFGVFFDLLGDGGSSLANITASNFSFNIPTNARIDGITAEVEYYHSSGRMSQYVYVDHIRVTVNYTTGSVVSSDIGTNGDYTTITAWESGKQGDFVSNTHIQKGVLTDSKDYNESVTFDGATCDRGFYWLLTVASDVRHDGTESTSCARIEKSSTGTSILASNDTKLSVEWLLLQIHDGVSGNCRTIRDNNLTATESYLEVKNCIVTCDCDMTVQTYNQTDAIYTQYGEIDVVVENTVVYGYGRTGLHAQMWSSSGRTQNWYVRNVTVDHCGYASEAHENANILGRNTSDANVVSFRCINLVSTAAVFGRNYDVYSSDVIDWYMVNCASGSSFETVNDGSLTNCLTDITTPDYVDTTLGSQDYHLDGTTGDLYDEGLDISIFFTNDIDGGTRSRWDIGADEYGVPAASTGWNISVFGSMDDPTNVIGVANANIVKITGLTV